MKTKPKVTKDPVPTKVIAVGTVLHDSLALHDIPSIDDKVRGTLNKGDVINIVKTTDSGYLSYGQIEKTGKWVCLHTKNTPYVSVVEVGSE